MSSSDSESDSDSKHKDNYQSLKSTYLLHKCQLEIEIKKLETMLRATEIQKDIVETLKNTSNILKQSLDK